MQDASARSRVAILAATTRRRALLLTPCALLALPTANATPNPFRLVIARKFSDQNCTSGYLAVNGDIIAYTLERPWLGNKPLLSSIPEGTYGGTLRYDHPDGWRIELTGVPKRDHVQIHTGNTPDDTEGCILVGLSLAADLCSVQESKKAYDALRVAFYGSADPISTPNKQIEVVITS